MSLAAHEESNVLSHQDLLADAPVLGAAQRAHGVTIYELEQTSEIWYSANKNVIVGRPLLLLSLQVENSVIPELNSE